VERGAIKLFVRMNISLIMAGSLIALTASAQTQAPPSAPLPSLPIKANAQTHFPAFSTLDDRGTSLALFSPEAYRAEFRYLRDEFEKTDLAGPAVKTDGWTSNISEAEWPVMGFSYLGYACANFAKCNASMREEALLEMRWLIDALQTRRMSGFVTPHFGEPFGADEIHVAVFVHGHFLNLAMQYREVSGDPRYDPLIERVAAALERAYLGSDGPILRSYRDMWWITDNLPALSGLTRYDRVFQRDTSLARKRFLSSIKDYYMDKATGLFCTYVNPEGHRQMQGARGISVMYGLHFLKDFDAAFASEQYELAKRCLVRSQLGFTAVREFPEGSGAAGDIDSGPVILGFGPSASGFAIAAAAVNGDDATAWELLKASALVGLPRLQGGKLQYMAMPTVGQAVVLFGKSELLRREVYLSAK
jgi:hypothetical protein